jgi:SH3-like domain-containing protein
MQPGSINPGIARRPLARSAKTRTNERHQPKFYHKKETRKGIMNTYLVQYVYTPTGVPIDTIVSADGRRKATRDGRIKISTKLSTINKFLRWKATILINAQGRLEK